MKPILLAVLSTALVYAQPWTDFLDSSRAVDWSSAGFTIPNYTVACSTQPSLQTGIGNAAANRTAIEAALDSCDATHNVVNLPVGTYYVTGFGYPSHGKQVVRGAGPNSTYIYLTGSVSCNSWNESICLGNNTGYYWGGAAVQPPSGARQCAWTAGYAKDTTTITLSSCGGVPPNNTMLILDQANDTTDTNGIYICDSYTTGCTGNSPANAAGRNISGVTHSQNQATWITGVTDLGGGSYSVTISPGVYFSNIRSDQSPGAYWPGFGQNNGLENMTIDLTNATYSVGMFNCYQCWIKNIRSLYGPRSHVNTYQSLQGVIRDSYFYQTQTPGTSQSYGVEISIGTSGLLLENNIFQQTTAPIMFVQGTGNVISYNFSINNQVADPNAQYAFAAHNAGSEMNLWEGNSMNGINADSSSWGGSTQGTFYRNLLTGWQLGKTQYTYAVSLESWSRAYNVIGNVLGQPGYSTHYESYATSTSGGVNGGDAVNTSVYALGWTGIGGWGGCSGPPVCGPLVRTTLMRWGNYDIVTAGVKWDSTEASPGDVPYVNDNFTSSYFDFLAHTLPASLYYSSRPSWWPTGKVWPPIGPDVTSGNVGICTGTYAGAQATTAGQCTGGTKSAAWDGTANAIPAQSCFLEVMGGPPDGSGDILAFDATQCLNKTTKLGPGTWRINVK